MSKNCGGMWKRKSKAGNQYFFVRVDLGALGEVELMAIANRYKEKENQPDLVLLPFDSNHRGEPEDRGASGASADSSSSSDSADPRSSDDFDNIPF